MANYLRMKKEEESQYHLENGSNLFTESSNMDNMLQGQVQIKNETNVASSENHDEQKVNDNSFRRGYTWSQALKIGILRSKGLKLTLNQIYDHVKREFPYYRTTNAEKTRRWKLVVRQTLSKLKEVFKRDGPEGGAGQWFVFDKDGMKCILKKAILTSKDLKLTSTQIYEFVQKEFLYYANQEEKDKWENYVLQNLCEMDKVFKHEGHEHGMGHWMVIDEDGIKAQKTLPSLLTPSPNISSSKPNSKVSPTLPASFPPKADYPQQIISKVSPTLPLTFPANADYSQQVNFKVSPTLPANFPPNADYPQLVNSKVDPTSSSNFPANAVYFQQVKYFQEKVEITRINRYNFANNNALYCRITQSNIEAASMSSNFADVELFRKHKDHLNRQYIDTMNQYYHEEINHLLQLKKLGALRNEDKHALHALSILAPNIYSSL